MSIKLQLAPYCDCCPRFEAYTEKIVGIARNTLDFRTGEEHMVAPVDFVISCSHCSECERMMEYLRKNVKYATST